MMNRYTINKQLKAYYLIAIFSYSCTVYATKSRATFPTEFTKEAAILDGVLPLPRSMTGSIH